MKKNIKVPPKKYKDRPRFLRDNFKEIEIDDLESIIDNKFNSFEDEFIFNSFGGFLPLSIYIPGLNDKGIDDSDEKCITERNVNIYYRTVNLGMFWLFIGIIFYHDEDKIYVFNAKSKEFNDPNIKVTMSNNFYKNSLRQLKALINAIANGLEL